MNANLAISQKLRANASMPTVTRGEFVSTKKSYGEGDEVGYNGEVKN